MEHPLGHTERIHRHERTDLSISAIVWFAVGLVVSGIVLHVLLIWMFIFLDNHKETGTAVSPFSPPRQYPPPPRLQVNEHEDLQEFRMKEKWALEHYGWVDQKNGVVSIPIDRAMDLIVERGLPAPAVPKGGAVPTTGNTEPVQSSGGPQ
jgi:hypothetical protein